VEARWHFYAREILCPDGRARRWALREGGSVVLRTGTDDIEIFEEIYALRFYEPPPLVRNILSATPVREICDIGGHVGLFGTWALRRYSDAAVVSFEPDPCNVAVLEACRDASAHASRWKVRNAAAGTASGTTRFLAGRGAMSREVLGGERVGVGRAGGRVVDVPVIDVFPDLNRADLIKIDIEGGEWALLEDPRFARCTGRVVVVVEYHPQGSPTEDAGAAARRLLRAAGYSVVPAGPERNGLGLVWGWRA
jgi:FkbM family methyltransferase